MTNFFDETRLAILPHLEKTAQLIAGVLKQLNKRDCACKITPLEDLGIPNNVTRMQGGFYTGCLVEWESDIPFVPVDTTVNACGVSVFELDKNVSVQEFINGVNKAKQVFDKTWNFDNGNHFISLCRDKLGANYLVIHASDNTYKYGKIGLYPYNEPWYESQIQTFTQGDRYLRYISGQTASDFYALYKQAEDANPKRNKKVCEIMFGENCIKNTLYTAHYGMPTQNSVAIGCQWGSQNLVLLTAPSKDIFIFKGDKNVNYPHGFGMKLNQVTSGIEYKKGELFINGSSVAGKNSFIKSGGLINRFANETLNGEFLSGFLGEKPFELTKTLSQICAFTRDGFEKY